MAIILLQLPSVEHKNTNRPLACPYCGSDIFQSWGRGSRAIRDTHTQEFLFHRFRCTQCQHTFRTYPQEMDQNHQTKRIRHLAVLLSAAGLSYRDVAAFFSNYGIPMSHMTIYRDAKQFLAEINNQGKLVELRKYVIDPTFLRQHKRRLGVGIAIDFGNGDPVVIGTINEIDPRKVKQWLTSFLEDVEIEVFDLATKDLNPLV